MSKYMRKLIFKKTQSKWLLNPLHHLKVNMIHINQIWRTLRLIKCQLMLTLAFQLLQRLWHKIIKHKLMKASSKKTNQKQLSTPNQISKLEQSTNQAIIWTKAPEKKSIWSTRSMQCPTLFFKFRTGIKFQ